MTDPTLTPGVYGTDHQNPSGLAAAKASMANAEPRTDISGTRFCSAGYHANQIVESCAAAYWLESHGHDVEYHREQVRDQLRQLADLFGFDVVKR